MRTQANPAFLRELAGAGGGKMVNADDGAAAIKTLVTELGRLQKTAIEAKAYNEYVVYFQWLLLPCLLLLIAEQLLWWRKK